jgi:hypothetical protein
MLCRLENPKIFPMFLLKLEANFLENCLRVTQSIYIRVKGCGCTSRKLANFRG